MPVVFLPIIKRSRQIGKGVTIDGSLPLRPAIIGRDLEMQSIADFQIRSTQSEISVKGEKKFIVLGETIQG